MGINAFENRIVRCLVDMQDRSFRDCLVGLSVLAFIASVIVSLFLCQSDVGVSEFWPRVPPIIDCSLAVGGLVFGGSYLKIARRFSHSSLLSTARFWGLLSSMNIAQGLGVPLVGLLKFEAQIVKAGGP